jgi:hypothetical protein
MGELIRYNGNTSTGLVKAGEARRVMDEALAKMRSKDAPPAPIIERGTGPTPLPMERNRKPSAQIEEIDLPRVCAVHDRYYVARYLRDPKGNVSFGQTFRVTESLSDQYQAGMAAATIPGRACREESCPWCGAHGFGAVKCENCGAEVCYGRTDAKRHFHCRPSCGCDGKLTTKRRELKGIHPYIGPDSGFSSGG